MNETSALLIIDICFSVQPPPPLSTFVHNELGSKRRYLARKMICFPAVNLAGGICDKTFYYRLLGFDEIRGLMRKPDRGAGI